MSEEPSAALRSAERARVHPDKRGWYEVYYVTLTLGEGRAAWLRYTLLVPAEGDATASLWGCAFDRARPRWLAGRRTWPGAVWEPLEDGGVGLAESTLTPLGCRGGVTDDGGRTMRWDLGWEARCGPFSYFPAALERLAAGATFPIAAVPVARAHGVVEVAGEPVACEGVRLQQAHLFGGRHAHRWGWLSALGFDADPEGTLTLISAVPERMGGRLPAASSLALRLHGRLHRSEGLRAVRWHDAGAEEVTFEGRAGAARVEGTVRAPAEQLVGVTYHDPDGAEIHCANTEVADLELRVRVDGVEERLRCAAACGFERGARQPMAGIWRPL